MILSTFTHIASRQGSVAERSKALVLGTSLFGGVGSNPTAATDFSSPYPDKSDKSPLSVICM